MLFATTLYSLGYLGLMKLVMVGVITFKELREYLKNSKPFAVRIPKQEKKGLTPDMPGFYNAASSLGDLLKSPY